MKLFQQITFCISVFIIFYCCNNGSPNDVYFFSDFNGAKLTKVQQSGNNSYIIYIAPKFEPVNHSPWYAFGVNSKTKKEIEIKLNYGKYKHRYIPKVSIDKKNWKKIDNKKIKIDTSSGIATLKLNVFPQKIYVAAQEIESSEDTYMWINQLLIKHPKINKVVAGKTALNKNNYALEVDTDGIANTIVLIARQHPPEIPGGTIGFKAFYEELLRDTSIANSFREQYNIYVFPLLNPDGADMGNWRHNANGVDLNRDWVHFTQPETQMVDKYLSQKTNDGKKICFAIDFHTSYSGPYILVLDSLNEMNSNRIIPKWINSIEDNSNFEVEYRRRSQELPYCYNYFYNNFNCEAITYEEGDEIDRDLIIKRAQVYAHELMTTLNKSNNY